MLKALSLVSLAFAFLLFGCASAPKAPKGPDGQKIAVEVSVDGGWEQVDEANPKQVSQRRQLVNFIEKETVRQLSGSGYEANLIDSAKGPKAGARQLKLRVVNYNPGSAAARVLVGFGAGAAVLDISAEYKDGGKLLLSTMKSTASGTDWRRNVRKIDILIMREMAALPTAN
jgi:hypothetical protein